MTTNARRARRVRVMAAVAAAITSITVLAGCTPPGSDAPDPSSSADGTPALVPVEPASPIVLNVLDGGALSVIQPAIDKFVADHPEWVKEVTYQSAASTDVPGKLKAQQDADAVDIAMVVGGVSILGAQGTDQYLNQLADYPDDVPDLAAIQDDSMAAFQKQSDGHGVLINFEKSGPILAFNPDVVSADEINTPEKLLAWAEAHPGRFTYAQPPNSGPGFQFLQSLPYMLGDSDPSDPETGWDKTWDYLGKLGKTIKTYPASSSLMNQQYGSGEFDVITTIVGQEILNRQSGLWKSNSGATVYADQNWMTDGHFAWIPKGVDAEQLFVALELEKAMVSVDAQTTANKVAVHSAANKDVYTGDYPADIETFVQDWARPDYYPEAQASGQERSQLPPDVLKKAFDLWQRNVGSQLE